MTKSIFKEIIIALLLCLAIILVLGVILYEYVPISKTIPSEVAYTTPEEVRQELIAAGDVDESEIVMTYEVNSDDLNNYRRVQDYKPGKANPFSSYQSQEGNGKEGGTATSAGTKNSGAAQSGGSSDQGSSSSSGSSDSSDTGSSNTSSALSL